MLQDKYNAFNRSKIYYRCIITPYPFYDFKKKNMLNNLKKVLYERNRVKGFFACYQELLKINQLTGQGGEFKVLAIENRKPWFCFETLNQINHIKIGMAVSRCHSG